MNRNDLMKEIMKYQFAAVELSLYLDNFPENKEAEEDFCKISNKLKSLICEYERNYGQLINFGISSNIDSRSWTRNPWPWENQKKRGCC
ncbi:MAG: spore coat protein CotJB [Clostridiaceae bacterium]|nr:spore coat protein CotJB [Clostridiaceae bacterium]